MRLSRRDALAALGAAGAGSLAGCSAPRADADGAGNGDGTSGERPVGAHELATLVALAEVVYPSELEGVEEFVRTYSGERVREDPTYAAGVAAAVDALDEYTATFHDAPYRELDAETRRKTLEYMSVDVAEPDAEGRPEQRVRHYLVNELLYALYTSPTGAGLAGLENPPGHPGGTESYRRGPNA